MGGWLYSVVIKKSLINVISLLENQLSLADSQTAMSKTENMSTRKTPRIFEATAATRIPSICRDLQITSHHILYLQHATALVEVEAVLHHWALLVNGRSSAEVQLDEGHYCNTLQLHHQAEISICVFYEFPSN
jgi:hypothetical protein